MLRKKSVIVDDLQVEKLAAFFAKQKHIKAFDFVGDNFPKVDAEFALDFFFLNILQQFGFWILAGGRYQKPFIAELDGKLCKGSDYFFYAHLRRWLAEPEFFTIERQAELGLEEYAAFLLADDGQSLPPALSLHHRLAVDYAKYLLAKKMRPRDLLAEANANTMPLQTLLKQLGKIPGYCEDPLAKKAVLLALILQQRPEKFLRFGKDEKASPVIDYHLMRSCLRVGLIEVRDESLRDSLVARVEISADDEAEIRQAAYDAIKKLAELSGKSVGALDYFFFQFRRDCPEMSEPLCESCVINTICHRQKELFQPIIRTSFY